MKSIGPYLLPLLFLLNSCQWEESTRPSVLILAVDSLPSDSITCSEADDPSLSGLAAFCAESIRFTHAYTTSVLTVPALSSVMTARLPLELGVRDNRTGLRKEEITLAEVAHSQSYRTGFFSGGAPVWRKSGLSQGFDTFEDNVPLEFESLYRPISKSVDLFKGWVERDQARPFFAVIYANDLMMTNVSTRTDSGETRAASFSGQFQEFDESLAALKVELQKIGKWDSSYIVIMGLNGVSPLERGSEVPGLNLLNENSSVALLVKPPSKKRDLGLAWSVDENVSLLDVGATIFEIFGSTDQKSNNKIFAPVSLKTVLQNPKVEWNKERPLLVESGWGIWRGVSDIRYALVNNHYLGIFSSGNWRIFNSLVDRSQTIPINDPLTEEAFKKILANALGEEEVSRVFLQEFSRSDQEKYQLALRLWAPDGLSEENVEELKRLQKISPADGDLVSWASYVAYKRKDWKWLLTVGAQVKRDDWKYLARSHLGVKVSKPSSGCLALADLNGEELRARESECQDPMFRELLAWMKGPPENTGSSLDRLVVLYRYFQMDRKIAALNYANGFVWDSLSAGLLEPSSVETFLMLPENRRIRSQLERRVFGGDVDQ